MAKQKSSPASSGFVAKPSLAASTAAVDPVLASLFASSSGPVKVLQKSVAAGQKGVVRESQSITNGAGAARSKVEDDDISGVTDTESEITGSGVSEVEQEAEELQQRPRKRRRLSEDENLEALYLDRLAREEEKEQRSVVRHAQKKSLPATNEEDSSDIAGESEDDAEEEADPLPRHEVREGNDKISDAEKLKRTVFMGNVSISAIKSKSARKELISHIKTALDSKLSEKVDSLRFRSTAFISGAGPKKAAYAKKELMDQTMKSTNAYVVLSSEAAARKVASRLNGSIVLGRHLRVDSMANPAKVDHKRCVFVGNLSFVDEDTVMEESEGGQKKRPRAKEPADVEEGLWRSFSKVGKIESVRVVRDKETRVSKGFAYVQFDNENGVEAALLMNEKKFPPMLPRRLRVMRAKKIKDGRPGYGKGSDSRSGKHTGGWDGKRPERVDGGRGRSGGSEKPGSLVFEGHRASSGSQRKLPKPKKRHATKPTTRSSRRGATFKATGGKRKRD